MQSWLRGSIPFTRGVDAIEIPHMISCSKVNRFPLQPRTIAASICILTYTCKENVLIKMDPVIC